ncbi:MAG: hypothetical protein ABEJ91_01445 [Candidatus Nanohaloarchaea archaeon]
MGPGLARARSERPQGARQNPRTDLIAATSPGMTFQPVYESDTVKRWRMTSHELVDELAEQNPEGTFDLEYGHALAEDIFSQGRDLDMTQQMERIERIAETSVKALREGGRADNLNRIASQFFNGEVTGDESTEDGQRRYAELFTDILEEDYFEDVNYTQDVETDNYHSDTAFVVADSPIRD